MSGPTAFVDKKRLRASSRRHPWIYANSVTRIEGSYEDGDAVIVRGPEGKFLAHAWINDKSKLRLRLVSFERKQPIEPALLQARLRSAVALRRDVLRLPERADAYRIVHSEADGLPGLIVDLYGDVVVLSCSVLGLRRALDPLLDALEEELSPRAILESDPGEGLREIEGLPEPAGVLRGEAVRATQVTIDGVRFEVSFEQGQKTGMFLDQRDNVRLIASLSAGQRVLDACCYLGAFGIAAAKAGAASVHLFDTSADAVARTEAHAALNGVAGERLTVRRGSLFRELTRLQKEGQTFDRIVLDPPKFAKRRSDVRKARKGYLDANQLALKLLAPDGLLLTCSCSGAFSADDLEGVLREAATRTNRELRVLERRGPGLDHPVDVHCPEGRYLKAILAQAR